MLTDDCYIQAQINLLEITMALAGEVPKRSGDFETTYKNESGKEIVVKRSPDGKFANKNGGATSQESTTTVSAGKTFSKVIGGSVDEIAKMPAKVQAAIHTAMFDSDLSRAIDKGVEKIIKSAYDPGLETGFKLGQSIKAELAKKPFSKFTETVTAKFEEFRKDLPQKSDDLRKEIIRIAKDPNTSTTIAAGALLGLAGNFYLAGIFSAINAGRATYTILRLPSVAKYAAEIMKTTPKITSGFTMTEEVATSMATGILNMTKGIAAVVIAGELIIGTTFNAIGHMIQDKANQALMSRVKSNEKIEKGQLKTKILAAPDDSNELYQEMIDRDKKEQEAKQKIVTELQKIAPKKPDAKKPEDNPVLAMPVLDIKLTQREEDYVADEERKKKVLEAAYKDPEFIKLSIAYMELRAIEMANIFGAGVEMTVTSDTALKSINERLTTVIKEEIKRSREREQQ